MTSSENFAEIESLLSKLKTKPATSETSSTIIDKLENLIKTEKRKSTGVLQKFRLDSQVALVTGGSRGIGYAIAQALGEAGCKVAIASINFENAKIASEKLQAQGIEALAIQVDVAQKSSVDE
ncbi:unnamed protein product, partial [Allacma fusca]